ncbi:hypothetical protein [Desulfonatronum parangueonense]
MNPYRWIIPVRWLLMISCSVMAMAMFWNAVTGVEPRGVIRNQDQDELVLQAENLLDVARGLAEVHGSSPAPELAVLFAVRPPAPPPAQPVLVKAAPPPMAFSVDMIIAAGEQGRAVLSGRLIRVGDVLGDGSRVVSIQADGVTLEKRGALRRLPAPAGRIVSP